MKKPAVFLDRDGTVCEYVPELHKIEDFKLREGAGRAIAEFNRRGYFVIVITNQPMVGMGLLTIDELDLIHEKMKKDLEPYGACVDAVYYCPHQKEKAILPEYKIDCDCRKPKTGMLKQACEDFEIDLERSYFIGDTWRDLECSQNFGLKFLGLTGGAGFPYKDPNQNIKLLFTSWSELIKSFKL